MHSPPSAPLTRGPFTDWPVAGLLGKRYSKENKFKIADDTDLSVLGQKMRNVRGTAGSKIMGVLGYNAGYIVKLHKNA